MKDFLSINPYTQATLAAHQQDTELQIQDKINKAWTGFGKWRNTPFTLRQSLLLKCAQVLEARKTELSTIMTQEMGKLLVESIAEIDKCILLCNYYATHLETMLSAETGSSEIKETNYVNFEPLGVILGIMPWNFPFWQVFRFAIPALTAGNTVLLKHASNVTLCAKEIEKIFLEAGFETGVFQSLIIESSRIEEVIANPSIKAISLTGSEAAGKSVGALAGKYIKKTVMELGSNDAFIVCADANLLTAATAACKSRLINNGQSCISAKRFIILEEAYDEFVKHFEDIFSKITMGNPLESGTTLGPLARVDLKIELKKQVAETVANGAAIKKFGIDDNEKDAFIAPTILFNPPKNSPAYTDELFGPVASIFKVKNIEDAIQLANDSVYGLGASVWTEDKTVTQKFIKELNVGSVFVNSLVYSHPALPFGGVNNSGFGRELGAFGIKEFVNVKSILINQ